MIQFKADVRMHFNWPARVDKYWQEKPDYLIYMKQTFSKGKKSELTDKLRRSENILKFVSCFNLMSNAKINQLDSGVRDVLIQQHDVLRLKKKKKRHKQAAQRE